jgi:hypothetical protein
MEPMIDRIQIIGKAMDRAVSFHVVAQQDSVKTLF